MSLPLLLSSRLSPRPRSSQLLQSLLAARLSPISRCTSANSAADHADQGDYFEKNRKLNRPLSPYVHYKPQMTTVLSITHRMTGLGLATVLYAGGLSAYGSGSTNFGQVLANISATVPHSLLASFKVLVGTILAYHTANGIRHLAWDMGLGFDLKQLYVTGYAVIGLTVAAYFWLVYWAFNF